MRVRKSKKLIMEGRYIAEVDIELIDGEDEWSPHLSLDDAYKLDEVKEALRRGDIPAASLLANIYTLTPVAL